MCSLLDCHCRYKLNFVSASVPIDCNFRRGLADNWPAVLSQFWAMTAKGPITGCSKCRLWHSFEERFRQKFGHFFQCIWQMVWMNWIKLCNCIEKWRLAWPQTSSNKMQTLVLPLLSNHQYLSSWGHGFESEAHTIYAVFLIQLIGITISLKNCQWIKKQTKIEKKQNLAKN